MALARSMESAIGTLVMASSEKECFTPKVLLQDGIASLNKKDPEAPPWNLTPPP